MFVMPPVEPGGYSDQGLRDLFAGAELQANFLAPAEGPAGSYLVKILEPVYYAGEAGVVETKELQTVAEIVVRDCKSPRGALLHLLNRIKKAVERGDRPDWLPTAGQRVMVDRHISIVEDGRLVRLT